jgi:DNA-binding NarL/FixJ family response regulator
MDDDATTAPRARVALVDDHALFRSGLRELLEEHGFEVVGEAGDGQDGVRLAAETAPDVIVMDLNMPGMSGVEATRRICATSPTTRVLILTVSPDDDDIKDAVLAGACGYVLKDAEIDNVVAGVAAAARGESQLSPRVATRLLERVRDHSGVLPSDVRPELTDREREVLGLIAAGKDNTEIAAELFISAQTVKNHVSNILAKLQVENRIQAAVFAVRRELL